MRPWFAQLVLVVALGGCTAISAPGPFHFQETERTVGPGRWRVDVAVGGGGGGNSDDGEGGAGGAARCRRGLGDNHELGLSGYAARLVKTEINENSGVASRYPNHLVVMGKLDYKARLSDRLALLAGLGGGFHTLGSFLAGDLGFLFALRRPAAVGGDSLAGFQPYAGIRAAFSVPLDHVYDDMDHPSFFTMVALGLRLPASDMVAFFIELGVGGIYTPLTNETQSLAAGYGLMGLSLTP